MQILMVAAENGALPGGKVGGIGDVIREMPQALAKRGHTVDIVTPGYQLFSRLPGADLVTAFDVTFCAARTTVSLFRIPAVHSVSGVTHWAIEHPLFGMGGAGKIYHDDGSDDPFATDATRFALFCTAVATALVGEALEPPDVLHLHDWHCGMLAMLRRYHPRFQMLRQIPAVLSIHNLAIQGIRPIAGHESSLLHWFPDIKWVSSEIADPQFPHCVNFMRAAIHLCERIHVVSPTYAKEILKPTMPECGFHGGEGLESDLQAVEADGRLFGILNGCAYEVARSRKPAKSRVANLMLSGLDRWLTEQMTARSAHCVASRRLTEWNRSRNKDQFVLSSIGRLTDQKVSLWTQAIEGAESTLDKLLSVLQDGLFILVGSGDPEYEEFFTRKMGEHSNLLFLNGFSEEIAAALFAYGDLFVMPSTFEPCGISHMQAMRAGQPCLVHGVGGLADTVEDGVTGFVFQGSTPREQAENLLSTFLHAQKIYVTDKQAWSQLSENASAARFPWETTVKRYEEQLYSNVADTVEAETLPR